MLSKNRLLTLSELHLEPRIDQMNDDQLKDFTTKMNYFIDKYPEQERNIKDALAKRDVSLVSKGLIAIWDMLDKIHAEKLAEKNLIILNSAKDVEITKLEADITAFFTEASALSIEMQMAQQMEEKEKEEQAAKVEYNILAVDDAAFFLGSLKSFLMGTQYKLTCLTSGETAIRYLQSHTPDLFLLDIEMPEMDGYALAKRIKTIGFKAPIIFLTGNASKEYVTKAIMAGGVDFIVKPIDKAKVMEKLKQHLG